MGKQQGFFFFLPDHEISGGTEQWNFSGSSLLHCSVILQAGFPGFYSSLVNRPRIKAIILDRKSFG